MPGQVSLLPLPQPLLLCQTVVINSGQQEEPGRSQRGGTQAALADHRQPQRIESAFHDNLTQLCKVFYLPTTMDTPHDALQDATRRSLANKCNEKAVEKHLQHCQDTRGERGQQWSVIDAAHIRLPGLTCYCLGPCASHQHFECVFELPLPPYHFSSASPPLSLLLCFFLFLSCAASFIICCSLVEILLLQSCLSSSKELPGCPAGGHFQCRPLGIRV